MVAPLSRETSLSQRSFERILLVKPSSLGDIVHALPVLHGLRSRYARARIDWLVGTSFAPLLEHVVGINECVLFDRRRLGRLGRSLSAAGTLTRLIRRLRDAHYELVVDLQGLFRTGFLGRATGAGVRLGFANAREGAPLFYTHTIDVADSDLHAVDRNYLVARTLGFEDVPVRFALEAGQASRAEARSLLLAEGLGPEARILAVAPGARWETKVWLPERFVETIDRIQGESDAHCVLLGGTVEAELCDRIAAACRIRPMNLAGRTDLRLLIALLERADSILCQDSGVMHLAVALNRPLICLIGPTNFKRTGPYLRSSDVVRLDLECSPCYLRKLSQCGYEHRCMRDLSSNAVVSAVRHRLET